MRRHHIALIVAVGLAQSVAAAELNAADYVSSKTIRESGLKIEVPGEGAALIVAVAPKGDPKLDCMVHVPSVIGALRKGLGRPTEGLTKDVHLQAQVDDNGELFCRGSGTGCIVKVQVPD